MNPSRRDFLKTTGLVCGVSTLPAWVLKGQAATAGAIDKNGLAELAISRAKKLGAAYADIRINRYRGESISTREERVLNVSQRQSFGFGIRVLVKGAWGFAASHKVTAHLMWVKKEPAVKGVWPAPAEGRLELAANAVSAATPPLGMNRSSRAAGTDLAPVRRSI